LLNFQLSSDLKRFEVKTATLLASEMGTGGGIYWYAYNTYGQGCGTPWLYGPNSFQLGDVLTTTYCSGFIFPNKVISLHSVSSQLKLTSYLKDVARPLLV
jgi:hypothetical protein